MTKLKLKNINVYYDDDFHAVKDVSIKVDEAEIVTLLGPSGCGKTSILRTIAGFVQPSSGELILDDEIITRLPPQKRNMGMIFQNYALWPHMTIKNNISYGLKIRKMPKSEINEIVERLVSQVKLHGQEDKYPTQLSGGQQQRVALARAVAIEPKILLCDEPLSNLDYKLRVELRTEIRDIAKTLGITVIYVTHDQTEALAISDRIAVIDEGVIIQIGTPFQIYNDPETLFVATFIGENNILTGIVEGRQQDGLAVKLNSGETIVVPVHDEVEKGSEVQFLTRFDALNFEDTQNGQMKGKVKSKSFMGAFLQVKIELSDESIITADIDENIPRFDAMKINDEILFDFNPNAILLFQSGLRIR